MPVQAPLQPMRVNWSPGFEVGHAAIDTQHRALVALCNELAGRCTSGDEPGFDQAFERLQVLAREHFDFELAWLQSLGDPGLDDHRDDCEEFGYLAAEIATTDHFDRLELQRFLALWWLGHVAESAPRLRELQAGGSAPA